jgi:hypothetical protein
LKLLGEKGCTGLLLCDFQWYQKKREIAKKENVSFAKKENVSFANISERKGKRKTAIQLNRRRKTEI